MWGRRWAAYLTACGLGFAVLETLGIRSRNRGDENGTLTCQVRRWLHIDPRGPRHLWGKTLLVGFLAWLGAHFLVGRWP